MAQSRKILCAVLLAGLALAIVLVAAETRRRQALYWYPVARDYDYEFDPRRATTVPVQVEHDTLRVPGHESRRGPAFLKLQLTSQLTGWWFEPCIEVSAGASTDMQCFERGVRGIRYVLLPPTGRASLPEIRLRGHHLRWDARDAAVVLVEAPDVAGRRILVLAPHPDDAEIAAFGLYSTHESYVVTLTAGGYADGLYADVELRSDVRVWDSLAVPLLGGVSAERTVNLGYPTNSLGEYHAAMRAGKTSTAAAGPAIGPYRRGAVEELLAGRPAAPSWSSVVEDLVAVLRAARPDIVVAPHPALDSAPDHQYATRALLEALAQVDDATTILLLYTNHHVHAEHYPFGPAGATVTLPPWFGGTRFAGIHSQPLDPQVQQRKLFALGAMHDLRARPEPVTAGPAGVLVQRLRQAAELVLRDPAGDYSYYRRAVRPNELFFAYWPEDRDLLAVDLPPRLTR